MILTIPLQPGTVLANVRYKWLVAGAYGPEQSTGITQPDVTFPEFRFVAEPPDGAEEIVAYDVTDVTNWNPGQYLLAAAAEAKLTALAAASRIPILPGRTVKFKSVLDRIMRRTGLDPSDSEINSATVKNLVEHINDRVYSMWFAWEWRFISLLEERAWRQIWQDDLRYDTDTQVYFGGDTNTDPGYYQALQPVLGGTPITDTNFWQNITPLRDVYLEYEQPFQTPIAQVTQIYTDNPRDNHRARTLGFHPSTRGIDISYCSCPPIPTVAWVKFKPPPPIFTMLPYVNRTYGIGERVFLHTDGNCYVKISGTNADPPPSESWAVIEFPERFQRYVTAGAYADLMRDMEKGVTDYSQRLGMAQMAEAEAMNILLAEIDRDMAEGKKMFFSIKALRCHRRDTGGAATPIATPTPPSPPLPYEIYYPDIVALRRATASPALDEIVTVGLPLHQVAKIVIDPNYPGQEFQNQEYRLMLGNAEDDDPGQVRPLDYDSTSNNKYWARID
jgi:hypothetical protein